MGSRPEDTSAAVRSFRYGGRDPSTRLLPGELWRATTTPDGPATLHLDWRTGALRARAFGPGGDRMLADAADLTGAADPGHVFVGAHPVVMRAQRDRPEMRLGASHDLYHELLPTVLAQRVTAGEAVEQWARLVYELGAPAPGPNPSLRCPPEPDVLAGRPGWWFHRWGIEERRAETLRTVARHAAAIDGWNRLPAAEAAEGLARLPGVGQWTIGSVLAVSHGWPDAVAVGDYHLKNVITHAFTGRPRGTDEEMLALLAPYAGQRGRVVRLLLLAGHRAPKFGARRRVVPVDAARGRVLASPGPRGRRV